MNVSDSLKQDNTMCRLIATIFRFIDFRHNNVGITLAFSRINQVSKNKIFKLYNISAKVEVF